MIIRGTEADLVLDERGADRRARAEPAAHQRRAGERRGVPARDASALVVMLVMRMSREQRNKLAAVARLNRLTVTQFVKDAIAEAVADCSDDKIF